MFVRTKVCPFPDLVVVSDGEGGITIVSERRMEKGAIGSGIDCLVAVGMQIGDEIDFSRLSQKGGV